MNTYNIIVSASFLFEIEAESEQKAQEKAIKEAYQSKPDWWIKEGDCHEMDKS